MAVQGQTSQEKLPLSIGALHSSFNDSPETREKPDGRALNAEHMSRPHQLRSCPATNLLNLIGGVDHRKRTILGTDSWRVSASRLVANGDREREGGG